MGDWRLGKRKSHAEHRQTRDGKFQVVSFRFQGEEDHWAWVIEDEGRGKRMKRLEHQGTGCLPVFHCLAVWARRPRL